MTKFARAQPFLRVRRHVVGVAEDFWKDGTENPFAPFERELKKVQRQITKVRTKKSPSEATELLPALPPTPIPLIVTPNGQWHAGPGEIAERLWGQGVTMPGETHITPLLIQALALTREMSVLDLSAGLGSRMRRMVEDHHVIAMGLEDDADIVARGRMARVTLRDGKPITITHYNPETFALDRPVDCIVARELFYRIGDRKTFFDKLAACTKPGAQVSFTDYIVNPEDRIQPAIKAWLTHEPTAHPLSLVEMAEEWAKVGFNIRVHDDQRARYCDDIIAGTKRLAVFLAVTPPPDAATKTILRQEIELWVARLAALQQGMKFYRFYGTKL